MKVLKITEVGNPVLRSKSRFIPVTEINGKNIREIIKNMEYTLTSKKLGVGLAANQVGENILLAIINVQKTKLRKNVEPFELVIINPKILKTFGNRVQMWEGCISSGKGKAGLFAKVPRFKKLKLEYYDKQAKKHIETFEGLPAQIIQHEVDHLNGILFVDRVKDTKTYMTYNEYKKMKKLEQ